MSGRTLSMGYLMASPLIVAIAGAVIAAEPATTPSNQTTTATASAAYEPVFSNGEVGYRVSQP